MSEWQTLLARQLHAIEVFRMSHLSLAHTFFTSNQLNHGHRSWESPVTDHLPKCTSGAEVGHAEVLPPQTVLPRCHDDDHPLKDPRRSALLDRRSRCCSAPRADFGGRFIGASRVRGLSVYPSLSWLTADDDDDDDD